MIRPPAEPIGRLLRVGVVAPLDAHFAGALARLRPAASEAVLLAAALVSQSTREGHVRVDLRELVSRPLLDAAGGVASVERPNAESWARQLEESELAGDGATGTPLVIEEGRWLYLRRYWQHERRLAELLRARVGLVEDSTQSTPLRAALDRLFGSVEGINWPRVAVEVALLTRFTAIVGGPGTGKTSTVVKLMAALVEQAFDRGMGAPRFLLLAPTGKAAGRLIESIRAAKERIDCPSRVRADIVEEAATIHRALGFVPGHPAGVRHDLESPLPADVVIVDEASMVDIALMRRLVEAVSPRARLVLLGDRDQLASVEAGAVLADLTTFSAADYSHELRDRIVRVFGTELPGTPGAARCTIRDHVVELVESHRFGRDSGIGSLARAIRRGDGEGALALLHAPSVDDVRLLPPAPQGGLPVPLRSAVVPGYRPVVSAASPEAALEALSTFRVLCAHRQGPAGVVGANLAVESCLVAAGWLERGTMVGRPVLITRNDYALGLFNGDVGVVWVRSGEDSARVFFPDPASGVRSVSLARLPPHEIVFAMSVHKSQGSEMDQVAILLPDVGSPLLTRELVYTAVTRARTRVTLYGSDGAVRAAVARRVQRATGLAELLWRE